MPAPRPHRAVLPAALAAALLAGGASACRANNSASSELSHVASGALIAGAAAWVADRRGAEDRRWTGFATSVALSGVIEGVQIATNGRHQVGPSTLDFVANLAGAAIGAWASDRWLLQPVLGRDAQGRQVVGAVLRLGF